MTRLHTSRSLLKLMPPRLLALGLCSLLGATSAHATLLVYEGFNYTDGLTNTASASGSSSATGVAASGTGLTDSWTMNRGNSNTNLSGTSFTSTNPLSFSTLSSTATRLQWTGQGSSANNNYLTASLNPSATTALAKPASGSSSTYWMSYLVQTSLRADRGGIYLGNGTISGDTDGRQNSTNNVIGFGYDTNGKAIITGGTTIRGTSTAESIFNNISYWMVGSFTFSTTLSTTQVTASLWVIPTDGGTLPTEATLGTATVTATSFTATSGNPTQLVFTTGSSSASVKFDEVRIGTTFLDVAPSASPIPEPSSAAFIAAGACGLLVCLRRRRITN